MKEKKRSIVIYTAIFGKKDNLLEPKFIPEDCDFVCFTDQNFSSKTWDVRKVNPPLSDSTRSARMYKVLAHNFFSDYEYSIWVDGNVLIKGDVTELIYDHLKNADMAIFDHAKWEEIPLSSLKEGLDQLLKMEREGKHQEDADLMERQMAAYVADGFPDESGLAWSLVILRRHNSLDIKNAMEAWWKEIVDWSKRDQMSFNYVAWKTGLNFNYIPLNGYSNQYTKRLNHYLRPKQQLYSYFLGAIKRFRNLLK